MRKFDRLEEMEQYQNTETGSYEFRENGKLLDIEITFNLTIEGNIIAENINAWNITAHDISAKNITALNITAWNIIAEDIRVFNMNALDINAHDITAWDISAHNISSSNINASNINAHNITAWNISAQGIDALNIVFYAVCFANNDILCTSIHGIRENSRYFSLDGKVIITLDKEKAMAELDNNLEK